MTRLSERNSRKKQRTECGEVDVGVPKFTIKMSVVGGDMFEKVDRRRVILSYV